MQLNQLLFYQNYTAFVNTYFTINLTRVLLQYLEPKHVNIRMLRCQKPYKQKMFILCISPSYIFSYLAPHNL